MAGEMTVPKIEGKEFVSNEYLMFIKTTKLTTWSPVACLKSNSIDIKNDEIDTTSKCSGRWKTSRAGQVSWTMQAEGNVLDPKDITGVATAADLKDLAKSGEAFEVMMVQINSTSNGSVDRGTATISSFSMSADTNGIKTFSVTLEGRGELFSTNA